MREVTLNFSNKVFYTFVVVAILILSATGIYAYGTSNPVVMGHSAGEVEGASIPSGAVMAFNLAACPTGWSEFTNARGRVVVGLNTADASFNVLRETGGEKTHILTVAEMPLHNHGLTGFYSNLQGAVGTYLEAAGTASYTNSYNHPITSNTGSGNAHNNLQPYIALLYCVKN